MAEDWGGAATGALSGAAVGSSFGPIGTVAGGLIGGVAGLFDGKGDMPEYTDPNAMKRQVLANNLMSSKTGEEYTAHQAAMNEHRGHELYDSLSKDYSGNPAVSSALFNQVERNTENENSTAGIEGARINEENQKAAGDLLTNDSKLGFNEWTANADRAGRPSILEQALGQGVSTFAGDFAGAGGRKLAGTVFGDGSKGGSGGNGSGGGGEGGQDIA